MVYSSFVLAAYILTTAVECTGFIMKRSIINYITKPLLMPLLLVYYVLSVETPELWVLSALFFDFLGDIAMLIPSSQRDRRQLLTGILLFLIGHLCYIAYFLLRMADPSRFPQWGILIVILILGFGAASYIRLRPYTRGFRPAVLAYISVLTGLMASAFFTLGSIAVQHLLLLFTGTVLFTFSDLMLGVNRLIRPYRGSSILVMSTYTLAQLLIISGIIAAAA